MLQSIPNSILNFTHVFCDRLFTGVVSVKKRQKQNDSYWMSEREEIMPKSVIAIIVAAFALTIGFACGALLTAPKNEQMVKLVNEKKAIQEELAEFKDKNTAIEEELTRLKQEYADTQKNLSLLRQSYKQLQNKFEEEKKIDKSTQPLIYQK